MKKLTFLVCILYDFLVRFSSVSGVLIKEWIVFKVNLELYLLNKGKKIRCAHSDNVCSVSKS